MKQFLFIGAISLLSISAIAASERIPFSTILAKATAEQPVCYGREYSELHMEANPSQKVKQLRAKIVNNPESVGSGFSSLQVDAVLRGDENMFKLWRAFLTCNAKGHCFIECDGGNVDVWGNTDGTLSLKNNGFVLEGGCDVDGETKTVLLEATKGGDDLFRLSRLPAPYCQN